MFAYEFHETVHWWNYDQIFTSELYSLIIYTVLYHYYYFITGEEIQS